MDTTELQNQAIEIRDAENEGENTALRVGTMLLAIIEALSNIVDTDTLQQVLADYASLSGTGIVNWRQSRCVLLDSMGANLDNIDGGNWEYVSHNGDIIYNPSSKNLRVVGEQGNYSVLRGVIYINAHSCHAYKWDVVAQDMVEIVDSSSPTVITYRNAPAFADIPIGASYFFYSSSGYKIGIKIAAHDSFWFDPDPKKIYAFTDTRQTAVWDAGTQTWIPIGNSVEIVDNLTDGGRNKSLSAEQGKILNQRISESQQHLQGLVDDMDAAEASSAVSAPSARIVKEIYINLKKLFDPETGLANIAFLGTRPTWESVNKRKFNLVMNASTLTGCTGTVVSGDAGNGQVYEGDVQIKLTPNTAYTFASIKVNGEDAASTPTGDSDNSVIIDIIADQDITVMATAVSGFAIAVSGSHVTNTQSHSGSTYTVTLVPDNQHFHLPDTITVKHGQMVLDINTHYTYNKNTGAVVISNVNDNAYSIEVTMVEDAKYNVTLDATGLTGASAVLSASQVYAGESATITITPNSGYTLNSIKYAINNGTQQDATISNNQAVITLSNINEHKSVVVTGSASIPTELDLNLKWFEEPAAQPTITEGQRFSLTLTPLFSNKTHRFIAAATQDAGTENEKAIRAAVQVVMNGVDISNDSGVVTFDETNNNVTIDIVNPRGRVIINATARLRITRNRGWNAVSTKYSGDTCCACESMIPFPQSVAGRVKYLHYGAGFAAAAGQVVILLKADMTFTYWSTQGNVYKKIDTLNNGTDYSPYFVYMKPTIGLVAAEGGVISQEADPNNPIYPYLSAQRKAETGESYDDIPIVPVVTREDFNNALFEDPTD